MAAVIGDDRLGSIENMVEADLRALQATLGTGLERRFQSCDMCRIPIVRCTYKDEGNPDAVLEIDGPFFRLEWGYTSCNVFEAEIKKLCPESINVKDTVRQSGELLKASAWPKVKQENDNAMSKIYVVNDTWQNLALETYAQQQKVIAVAKELNEQLPEPAEGTCTFTSTPVHDTETVNTEYTNGKGTWYKAKKDTSNDGPFPTGKHPFGDENGGKVLYVDPVGFFVTKGPGEFWYISLRKDNTYYD